MALAGNRRPVGFIVRRPLTLWGVDREVGEYIPIEDVESMVRLEAMVRAGRFNAVYEEGGMRVERKRGSSAVVERTEIPEAETRSAPESEVLFVAEPHDADPERVPENPPLNPEPPTDVSHTARKKAVAKKESTDV